jgi:hypothetical protein
VKNLSIKLTSLGYIGVALLCLAYTSYFSKTLYYKPFLQFYDLLLGFYIYVAVPAIYFSAAAFVAIVIYTLVPGTIAGAYRKYLLSIALLILLVYAMLILPAESGLGSFPIPFVVRMYPIVFAVPGALFALGLHKK